MGNSKTDKSPKAPHSEGQLVESCILALLHDSKAVLAVATTCVTLGRGLANLSRLGVCWGSVNSLDLEGLSPSARCFNSEEMAAKQWTTATGT